jgi:RimJ/RimL family protein N-acetyltransferase
MCEPEIPTSRLLLDPLRAEDAGELFACRAHPQVARYQGWRPADQTEATAFIVEQATRQFGTPGVWSQLAIRDRRSRAYLGDLGVHFPATSGGPMEFGVSLKPQAQHRGFAREAVTAINDRAFSTWGCHRIIASVDPRNVASLALCRALGMREEAHHVESCRIRGEWLDEMIFALLAREWLAARPH